MAKKPKKPLEVETLKHDAVMHKNIPTAGFGKLMDKIISDGDRA